MINKPSPFKGLNIRIPSIIPIREGVYQSGVWVTSDPPEEEPPKRRDSTACHQARLCCRSAHTGDDSWGWLVDLESCGLGFRVSQVSSFMF